MPDVLFEVNPRTLYFLFFASSIDNKPIFPAGAERCVLTELPLEGNFKSSLVKQSGLGIQLTSQPPA